MRAVSIGFGLLLTALSGISSVTHAKDKNADFALVSAGNEYAIFIEKGDIKKERGGGKYRFLVFESFIYKKGHKVYSTYPSLAFTRDLISVDCSVGFYSVVGKLYGFSDKDEILDVKDFSNSRYTKPAQYSLFSDVVSYVCPALNIPVNRPALHIYGHGIYDISKAIKTYGNVQTLLSQQ